MGRSSPRRRRPQKQSPHFNGMRPSPLVHPLLACRRERRRSTGAVSHGAATWGIGGGRRRQQARKTGLHPVSGRMRDRWPAGGRRHTDVAMGQRGRSTSADPVATQGQDQDVVSPHGGYGWPGAWRRGGVVAETPNGYTLSDPAHLTYLTEGRHCGCGTG